MFRGISFLKENGRGKLCKIFEGIDVTNFNWYYVADESEVWTDNENEEYFDKKYYSGKEFSRCIDKDGYVIFLKLQAYSGAAKTENIASYEEYVKSDCQIVVLIYDCEYVEIYCKNTELIKAIFEQARRINYRDVELITDENDCRTSFCIK